MRYEIEVDTPPAPKQGDVPEEDYKMALRLIRQDILYRAKCDKTNAEDHPYWGIVSEALEGRKLANVKDSPT